MLIWLKVIYRCVWWLIVTWHDSSQSCCLSMSHSRDSTQPLIWSMLGVTFDSPGGRAHALQTICDVILCEVRFNAHWREVDLWVTILGLPRRSFFYLLSLIYKARRRDILWISILFLTVYHWCFFTLVEFRVDLCVDVFVNKTFVYFRDHDFSMQRQMV